MPQEPGECSQRQPALQPDVQAVEPTMCCIVGGGPAGAVLALLLARQGVPVVLLESHLDFDRDFRGDTLHPSTMEIMDELGLVERLLEIRHTKVRHVAIQTGQGPLLVDLGAGFARLRTKFPYITVMAQARFLEFITAEAKRYPSFRLIMGAQVDGLLEEGGTVRGVRYRHGDHRYTQSATLVVGTDGRFSKVRKLADFTPISTSPPIDVLWFRLSRRADDALESLDARSGHGLFVVVIDRFDYWQLGVIIPKGGYQQLRAAGLEQLRRSLAQAAPELADRVDELQAWNQMAVLSVESSRLPRWYRAGLLLIGDAAHVMSPVGGVGINYAIADAVVTSNLLGPKLQSRLPITEGDLAAVQAQREWPTRAIQTFQTLAQKAVMARLTQSTITAEFAPPRLVRWLLQSPRLLKLPAWFIGFGFRPPHVKESA